LFKIALIAYVDTAQYMLMCLY